MEINEKFIDMFLELKNETIFQDLVFARCYSYSRLFYLVEEMQEKDLIVLAWKERKKLIVMTQKGKKLQKYFKKIKEMI